MFWGFLNKIRKSVIIIAKLKFCGNISKFDVKCIKLYKRFKNRYWSIEAEIKTVDK